MLHFSVFGIIMIIFGILFAPTLTLAIILLMLHHTTLGMIALIISIFRGIAKSGD